MTAPDDRPKVAVRPPVVVLGGLLAGSILEIAWPLGPGLAQGRPLPVMIGLGLAVIGSAIFAYAHRQFARAGNPVSPRKAIARLVTDGLYAATRNPVYIALTVVYLGLVVALTTVWGLLLLPAVVAVLHKGVVLPEERYLAEKFGDDYRAYAARVPRWL